MDVKFYSVTTDMLATQDRDYISTYRLENPQEFIHCAQVNAEPCDPIHITENHSYIHKLIQNGETKFVAFSAEFREAFRDFILVKDAEHDKIVTDKNLFIHELQRIINDRDNENDELFCRIQDFNSLPWWKRLFRKC